MSVTAPVQDTALRWGPLDAASPSLFRWTHGLINRLVTLGDVGALLLSGLLQPWLDTGAAPPFTAAQTLLLSVSAAVIFVFTLQAIAGYRVETYARLWRSLACVVVGLACVWAIGAAYLAAFAPSVLESKDWALSYALPQLALLCLGRIGAWVMVGQIDKHALMRRNTIVIGCNAQAEAVTRHLTDARHVRAFNVLGVVGYGSDATGLFAGRPLLGNLSALVASRLRDTIDLVVIVVPLAQRKELGSIIDALQWVSADVVLSVDETTAASMHRPLADVAGLPVLPLMQKPLKGSQALLKLIEDRVIAAIALFFASPILLAAAVAIRLDSPGPILFRQDRIGLQNRTFRIFKFRTMTVDPTDDGARGTTSRHDPRITRVGRILRSLSIDELPQLLNVLLGDMSIVGPRPYVRNMQVEEQAFDATVQRFAARHRIKPGITGLAQASGFRSNALRNKRNAAMSVELDMQYIASWSLWLDLKIMVRTLAVAMTGPEVF
jgi:putative colanic acid biosynthesis UDP-glucose lipid carrier transferase